MHYCIPTYAFRISAKEANQTDASANTDCTIIADASTDTGKFTADVFLADAGAVTADVFADTSTIADSIVVAFTDEEANRTNASANTNDEEANRTNASANTNCTIIANASTATATITTDVFADNSTINADIFPDTGTITNASFGGEINPTANISKVEKYEEMNRTDASANTDCTIIVNASNTGTTTADVFADTGTISADVFLNTSTIANSVVVAFEDEEANCKDASVNTNHKIIADATTDTGRITADGFADTGTITADGFPDTQTIANASFGGDTNTTFANSVVVAFKDEDANCTDASANTNRTIIAAASTDTCTITADVFADTGTIIDESFDETGVRCNMDYDIGEFIDIFDITRYASANTDSTIIANASTNTGAIAADVFADTGAITATGKKFT